MFDTETVKLEQDGMSKAEVMELMEKQSEFAMDLDNMPPKQHNWIDRGGVMSCEGATHPNHRVFKRLS